MLKRDFRVKTGDVNGAIEIIKEVAQWCIDNKIPMWRMENLTKDILTKGVADNNFCIGQIGNDDATSMILQWCDPIFWPQAPENESGYIHKLCVRRSYAGMKLSEKMVEYAIGECKRRGIRFLRLDTYWGSNKLCQLYENIGFKKINRKEIGSIDYAIYELTIK